MTSLKETPSGEFSTSEQEGIERLLFAPASIGPLTLANRVVMPPMTRSQCFGGVPTDAVASYYARRAAAGVGLIIAEGAGIDHPGATNDPDVPAFHGAAALAGWRKVLDAIHAVGGRIIPQLWHIGLYVTAPIAGLDQSHGTLSPEQVGPSGLSGSIGLAPHRAAEPMTVAQIEGLCDAFASAAETAFRMGFDGVELHGGHGYLIDQFLWAGTNRREDAYGGSIARRARFAADIVREIRRRTAPDFPILFRFSQWKLHDYTARLAETPQELAMMLEPLVDAGVDLFDCSQRRFWEPEFAGDDRNLAGWTRELTGKPTMTVGSVGLDGDMFASFIGESASPASLGELLRRLEREEFDLVGVGRALLVDPDWATKVRAGHLDRTLRFTPDALATLT